MGENVNSGTGASASSATVFQQVTKDSDAFKTMVALLRSFYLGSVSQNCFQYSQASLVMNSGFIEECKTFAQQKAASGYTEEELKEDFAFLFFDSESQAKLVCETGVCVGSSTMSTLGDPLAGVYISKYSNYLHPRPWYHGKSGYIIILKLIKGKVKVVLENYTSNYTAPSPGYDCHVSANLGKVTAETSHCRAFELNQYYIYEFHDDHSIQRPRQICPFAILAFQYTEPKRTIAILKDKVVIGHKNQVFYTAWKGPLVIQGHLVCDIVLQSLHTSAIPAQLPKKLEVKEVIHVSALKKQLPVGVFEKSNFIKKEAQHQGFYCSLYEVITTNESEDKLNRLIGEMKKKDLAIIRSLNDQGFLLLITSSVLTSGKEFDVRVPAGLLALFIFSSSRLLNLQNRRSLIAAEHDLSRETNAEEISLMVTSLLPGLQYALLEIKKFQDEVELSPSILVEKYFQQFTQLQRTGSLDMHDSGNLMNLSLDLSVDELAPYETCRKMALPRLRSYIADPSNFALGVSQMMMALQFPVEYCLYPCLISDSSCEVVTSVLPEDLETENAAAAPHGKSRSRQRGRSNNIKEMKDELNPRRQQSKRKGSIDTLTSTKRKWSPQILPSTVDSIANRKGTRTKKITSPISAVSKKQGQGSAQNTDKTTVKLANIQFPQRRKRGAEVLTAEFVQHMKPESSTGGVVSREDGSSGLSIKKAKELEKSSNKIIPNSKKTKTKMTKKAIKSKVKEKKQHIVRKQVEPAKKAAFASPSNKILSGTRGIDVDIKKSPKKSPVKMVKPTSGNDSRQNKNIVAVAQTRATSKNDNSDSKSISAVAQVSSRNSDIHSRSVGTVTNSEIQNRSSVTIKEDSSNNNDVHTSMTGMILNMESGQSDIQGASTAVPNMNFYETHALNLLADLALSSLTTSTMPSVVRDDNLLPSKSTELSAPPKERPVRTATDHEYHRVDKRRKGGHSTSNAIHKSPSTAHRHLLRQDINLHPLVKKGSSGVMLESSLGSAVSHISLEHSYTLPFSDHSKKCHGKYRAHSVKVGSAVIGKVMPFRHQQKNVPVQIELECPSEKSRSIVMGSYQKTVVNQSRTVLEINETFRVTCTWEAEYLFHLDSKYTSDPLEKTVNRALHGPWDPDLPDNVEEVKLILHTWVALFYNKPNKLLSSASRKVVEHSNPAKYVSINSTLDPSEVLQEDGRSPKATQTCADSPSEATDKSNSANNCTLPLSHSPPFCSKSPTPDCLPTHAPGKTKDSIDMFLKNQAGQQAVSTDECNSTVSDYHDKINGHETEQEEASLSFEESCKRVSSSNECSDGNRTCRILPSNESDFVPNTADKSQSFDFNKTPQKSCNTSEAEFSPGKGIERHIVDGITSESDHSKDNKLTVSLKDNEEDCAGDGHINRLNSSEDHQTKDVECLNNDRSSQEQIALNVSIDCKEGGSDNLDNKNWPSEQVNKVYSQEVLILEENKLGSVATNKSLWPNDLSQAALPSASLNNQAASHKLLQSLNELAEQQKLGDAVDFGNMKLVQIDTMPNKHSETSLEDARHSFTDQSNKTNRKHETVAAQELGNCVTAMAAFPKDFPTEYEPDAVGPRNTNIISVSEEGCPQSEGLTIVQEIPESADEVNVPGAEKSDKVNDSLSNLTESPDTSSVHDREKALDKGDFTQHNFLDSRIDCESEEVCSEKDDLLCISDKKTQNINEQRSHPVTEFWLISLEKCENDVLQNKTKTSDQKGERDCVQANVDSDNRETNFQDMLSHSESDAVEQEHEKSLAETTGFLKKDIKSRCISNNKPVDWERVGFRNSICASEGEETKHLCDGISAHVLKVQSEEHREESPVNMEDDIPVSLEYISEEEDKTKQALHENAVPVLTEVSTNKATGEESTANMGDLNLMKSEYASADKQKTVDTHHKSSMCKVTEQSDQLLVEPPSVTLGDFGPLNSVCAFEGEQTTVDACHESSVCTVVELQHDQLLIEQPSVNLGDVHPVSSVCASDGEHNIVDARLENSVDRVAELKSDQLLVKEPAANLGDVHPMTSVCASDGEQKVVDACHEKSAYRVSELQSDQTLVEEPAVNLGDVHPVSPVCASDGEHNIVDARLENSVDRVAELKSDQLLVKEPAANLGDVHPMTSVCAADGEQKVVDACHEKSAYRVSELQSDQLLVKEPAANLGDVHPMTPVCASDGEPKVVDACHEKSVYRMAELQSDQLLVEESAANLGDVHPMTPVCAADGEPKVVDSCHEKSVYRVTGLQSDQPLEEAPAVNLGGVHLVTSVSASEGEQKVMDACHEKSVYRVTELQSDQTLVEEPAVNLGDVHPVSPVCASDGEHKVVDACLENSVCGVAGLQSDQLLVEEPAANLGEEPAANLGEEPAVNLGNVHPVSPVCASDGEHKVVDACLENSVVLPLYTLSDQPLEEAPAANLGEEPAVNLGDVHPVSPVCASDGEHKVVDACLENSVCRVAGLQSDQPLEEASAVNLGGVHLVTSVCASEGEQKVMDVFHETSVCRVAELRSDQLLAEEPSVNLGGFSPVSSGCATEGEQKTVGAHHDVEEVQSDQLIVEEPEVNLGGFSPVSSECAADGEQKTVDACHESSICREAELQSDQLFAKEPYVNLGGFSPVSSVCASEGEQKTVDACYESSMCREAELQSDQFLVEERSVSLGGFSPVSSVYASEGEQTTVDASHDVAELQSDQLLAVEPSITLGGFSPVSSVGASESEQTTVHACHESSVCRVAELQSDQLLAEEPSITLGGFSPVSSVGASEGEERLVNAHYKSSVCKETELKSNKEKTVHFNLEILEPTVEICTESPDEGLYSPSVQKSLKSSIYESFESLFEAGDAKNSSEPCIPEYSIEKDLSEESWANHFHKQRNTEQDPNGDGSESSTAECYGSFVSKIRDTARNSVLKRCTFRYPEYESGKNSYEWDYKAMNKRVPPFDSVGTYRCFHTMLEEEMEYPPLPNHITNHCGSSKNYINFTVKKQQRDSNRALHNFQEDTNFTERSNQMSAWNRKWMVTDLTQNTLDIEYLRFNHKLKQDLKHLAPPISSHANRLTNFSGQATVKTLVLQKGPERQISNRANSSRTPLLITIKRSDAGQGACCQHTQCKVKCDFTAPPFSPRFQDKADGGRKAPKSKNQTSRSVAASFHSSEFKYGKKLGINSASSGSTRHARMMSGMNSVGMMKGQNSDMEEEMESSEEIQNLLPQSTTSYKSMITDLCSSLCFKLNSVAKDACKKPFMFFILETSDDPSFRRMKNLLIREGHTEMEVLPFCQAEHLGEDTLVIIIRNEDISSHVHEIPHLLRLKLLPNVIFAGVDSPEDVVNYTYQGLFHSGGFVVSEETVLETVTVGQLKEAAKILEKLNENGRWKWFIHYKEEKKLREDSRVNLIAQKKSLILKSCQQTNIVEVLHYHPCDSRSPKKSEELKCLLNLQIQHIGSRLALFLTDKPSTMREVFEKNGILVTDIATFLGTIQRLAAPFRTTYW